MATQVQFRRGTTTQNNAFTGANGEISVDTDVKTLRLHDGTTGGGASIMMNTTTAQTALNKTFSSGSVWTGNAVGLAYGGTGSSLSAVQGAIAYSGASGFGLSAAGTSGQVLISGGTGSPVWVNASSLTTGTATVATTATNIAGGSAGQLIIQSDVGLSAFITAGATGTFLKSAGAGYAPEWAAGQVTLGTSDVPLGSTATTLAALTSITMQNGSYGGGTVGNTITGSGPWVATITGISSTTGINVGQYITAVAGTGSLFGGSPTSVVVTSVVSATSITVTVTGGTTPTAGTITSITTFGYLQVPVGTTAQRPWVAATGMIRYNSSTVGFEGYSSGSWSSLGGVSSVDKFTYIQAETSAGASNGELEFFVENSAGNAAVKAMGITNAGVTIAGNLTVDGTTTTINSVTLTVDDKNIELGSVASPTDTTAAGGGITLKGATDKVVDWNATTGWRLEDDIATRRLFTGTTSSTSATSILAVSASTYRSGVIEMQVVNSTSYRICRLMFVHDGTTVTISENYLVGLDIQTATTNTTFTADISSGNVRILATAASGTSTIKGECTLFKV
jgi:hypothetical protein